MPTNNNTVHWTTSKVQVAFHCHTSRLSIWPRRQTLSIWRQRLNQQWSHQRRQNFSKMWNATKRHRTFVNNNHLLCVILAKSTENTTERKQWQKSEGALRRQKFYSTHQAMLILKRKVGEGARRKWGGSYILFWRLAGLAFELPSRVWGGAPRAKIGLGAILIPL